MKNNKLTKDNINNGVAYYKTFIDHYSAKYRVTINTGRIFESISFNDIDKGIKAIKKCLIELNKRKDKQSKKILIDDPEGKDYEF